MAPTEAATEGASDVRARDEREPALRVVVHDTLAGLTALEPAWRALAAEARDAGPFLGFGWNRACAELFTGERCRLHVVTVERDCATLGIAPWVVSEPARWSEPRRIGFLGAEQTACDYLDVLCAAHAERSVAHALYAHLFGPAAPRWHQLELAGVRAGSRFLFHFRECFERAGKHVVAGAGAYCPTRRLDAAGVLDRLPARRQKRMRYDRQVLERAGPLVLETRSDADAAFRDALSAFAALYRERWGGARDALRCVEAYAPRADEAGRLRVDLLRVEGRAVAGLLHLQRGDVLYLYLMAVDREAFPKLSLGGVLIGLVLERAAGQGIRVYDFLRGGEDYKLSWSDGAERCVDFTAFRPGAALLGRLALAQARAWLKVAWR